MKKRVTMGFVGTVLKASGRSTMKRNTQVTDEDDAGGNGTTINLPN